MGKRSIDDKAHEILVLAGIKANSRAYKTLKSTVEELVAELHAMSPKEQSAFAVSAVQIYDRYVHNAYNKQHQLMKEKSEDHIIKLEHFHGAIDSLLKKISVYMHKKKVTKISLAELNQLFGTKAECAKELLDRCPLVERDSSKQYYKFKDPLKHQLKKYFVGCVHNE